MRISLGRSLQRKKTEETPPGIRRDRKGVVGRRFGGRVYQVYCRPLPLKARVYMSVHSCTTFLVSNHRIERLPR